MVEGFWSNEVGMHSNQVVDALPASMKDVKVQILSEQSELWGGEVHDERYVVTAVLTDDEE